MDLCLRGSQINLATRQKPKSTFHKYSATILNSTGSHFRPRSANFIQQRRLSSPFLRRPQSADPKFGRKLSIYFPEKEYTLAKRKQQAVRSNTLCKALLEEPIRRSWLTRNHIYNSSTDEQSDFSSSQQTNGYSGLIAKRTRTNSADGISSFESEHHEHISTRTARQINRMSNNSGFVVNKNKYWSTSVATIKPDLPGRVSFSKTNLHNDNDLSDCDNDKQLHTDDNISAPGPLVMANYSFSGKNESGSTVSSASQKKTVHFGAAGKTDEDKVDILAETYEYPKCPSENCTCSTRSSSTTSTHEANDMKCACDAPSCRFSLSSTSNASTSHSLYDKSDPDNTQELKVIRDYKNVVGGEIENSITRNLLLEEAKPKNNFEVPAYLEKYAAPNKKASEDIENQNNLSETTENNLLPDLNNEKQQYSPNGTESVIDNYLKIAATTTTYIDKKRGNSKPVIADTVGQSENKQKSKILTYNGQSSQSLNLTDRKLNKAKNISNLRGERALSEYNLDKVDTWMSINEQKLFVTDKANLSEQTAEFEKFNALKDDTNDEDGSHLSDENSLDSTYNEIVSVIKEIEEDKKQDNYAEHMPGDLDLKLDSRCVSSQTNSQTDNTNETPDKYKNMLEYLEDVENSCDKSLLETRRSIPDSNRSEIEFVVEPDITEDIPKLSDLLMLPNHQLARRVVTLSLRANELSNAMHLSKEHGIKLRNENQKLLNTEKTQSAIKLRNQKKHYEEIVKRHQGFVEQLLKDKGSLCEKVAALTRRLESQNQAWEHRLETELTRTKETAMAGEKIRRERWVRENTKKIKELTVKGIEADINKMNCEHQREITELKRAHQEQLLDALEEARLKHEQIESSIRETCAQDRETIIEKERAAIRERFDRQLEEEQKLHDEQKQKLCEEFANEKERLQTELRQKENDYQAKRQEAQRDHENELEQVKFELQEKLVKHEEKYQNRINNIEKQYMTDFEIWKREFENSCKATQVEKENVIRQHYRIERDRQLDELVIRMETEALQSKEEYEQKLLRLKEKYSKDLTDMETVEKSLRDKYTETRTKLAESDAQMLNYQAELKQLKMELDHSKKMCDEFLNEREQLRENIRSDLQNEITVLKQEHNKEIETLHKRVQQTIGKKDAQIDRLENENGNLRERCLKLEAVIRQQRKDYCAK